MITHAQEVSFFCYIILDRLSSFASSLITTSPLSMRRGAIVWTSWSLVASAFFLFPLEKTCQLMPTAHEIFLSMYCVPNAHIVTIMALFYGISVN